MPTMADIEHALMTAGAALDVNESRVIDCADVIKYVVEKCTGRSWEYYGLWGHAGDMFNSYPTPPFTRIWNNPNEADQVPPRGSFIHYRAPGKPGHTAYVRGAGRDYIDLIEADTYVNKPAWARRVPWVYPGLGVLPVGWINPWPGFYAPQPQGKPTIQRPVAVEGARYRALPRLNARILQTFPAGAMLTFDATTNGDVVDGDPIWLRGAFTGGWIHRSVLGGSRVTTDIPPVPTPR